jgi:pimeloyl-ACP methyl ester carboxylesterase
MQNQISTVLALTLVSAACSAREPAATTTQKPTTESSTTARSTTAAPKRKGYVPANGLRYYYEIRGSGEPLLLLHGGLGSIEMFGPVLTTLSKSREVIALDLHGHGRTQLGDRKLDLIDSGNDLAVVLEQLGYAQVDVLGYSLGAGVAFRLAVQHPDKVRRLVLASGAFSRDGYYPELLPMQAQVSAAAAPMMKDTPMYKSYAAIAPDPSEFPKLLDRIGELMRQPYDWSEDAKKLAVPTMLVYGDSDMFRLEHVVEFYHLLGGGLKDAGWMRENMSKNRLAVIPNVTHYEMFMSPALVPTVLPFLDGNQQAGSWAEQVAHQ